MERAHKFSSREHELKMLRTDLSLTQQQAAEQIGITVANYNMIEKKRKIGSFKTWKKIQEVFQIDDDLLWKMIKDGLDGEE